MDRRSNVVPTASPDLASRDEASVAIARSAFSAWLRAAREMRGISLEEVARVTRIQLRTLERLEDAAFSELPADVFVRGFIRNYARVVGLDAEDAIARYDDCGVSPGPVAALTSGGDAARGKAKAFVDVFEPGPTRPAGVQSVVPKRSFEPRPFQGRVAQATPSEPMVIPVLAAGSITEIPKPEPEPEAEAVVATPAIAEEAKPKRKRGKRGGKGRAKKKTATAATATTPDVAPEDLEVEITIVEEVVRPLAAAPIKVAAAPSLVIDDDDPDSAEREREERAAKDRPRSIRDFGLPQALLDSDRGSRQGGLTLAVIILLIVATLTLSYLMRRPSAGGEGVTWRDVPTDVA